MTEGTRRTPERRSDDTRLVVLELAVQRVLDGQEKTNIKLDRLSETLNAIQSEPEQFPAGRALLARANENKGRLDRHADRLDGLEDWQSEMNGVSKFTRIVQTILGIALAMVALYAALGPRPA